MHGSRISPCQFKTVSFRSSALRHCTAQYLGGKNEKYWNINGNKTDIKIMYFSLVLIINRLVQVSPINVLCVLNAIPIQFLKLNGFLLETFLYFELQFENCKKDFRDYFMCMLLQLSAKRYMLKHELHKLPVMS